MYKVGSSVENVWSDVYTFRAMRDGPDWSPSIALYGDFGFSNHQSLQRLFIDKAKGMYDAILHVGKNFTLLFGEGFTIHMTYKLRNKTA